MRRHFENDFLIRCRVQQLIIRNPKDKILNDGIVYDEYIPTLTHSYKKQPHFFSRFSWLEIYSKCAAIVGGKHSIKQQRTIHRRQQSMRPKKADWFR